MTDIENCCPGWWPGHLRPNRNSWKPAKIITASVESHSCIAEMENEQYWRNQCGILELLEKSQITLENGEKIENMIYFFFNGASIKNAISFSEASL